MRKMTWVEFATRYCETQESEPDRLADILRRQIRNLDPDGFFLAECQMMDSGRYHSVVILPYGAKCTFHGIPDKPFSPRGLASDMSVAIGWIPARLVPKAGSVEHTISMDYLTREKNRGNDVEAWIRAYCRRNKVDLWSAYETAEQLKLTFRSAWQLKCFVRQGNRAFPHFEFW